MIFNSHLHLEEKSWKLRTYCIKKLHLVIAKFLHIICFNLFGFICLHITERTFRFLKTSRFVGLSPKCYIILAMFQYNDSTTDVWLLKLSEQQDLFRFRMHAQRVCIIAAYPVLRLCDAGNIAALSAHDVSNTELPHEFASSLPPHRNSVHNTQRPLSTTQLSLSMASRRNGDIENLFFLLYFIGFYSQMLSPSFSSFIYFILFVIIIPLYQSLIFLCAFDIRI